MYNAHSCSISIKRYFSFSTVASTIHEHGGLRMGDVFGQQASSAKPEERKLNRLKNWWWMKSILCCDEIIIFTYVISVVKLRLSWPNYHLPYL